MRSRFAAPLLLLLAALAAVPAAAQVQGRYRMVSINGQALPAASPMQRRITFVSSVFWFDRDGYASMATEWNTPDGPSVQRVVGTYATARDSLRFIHETGETVAEFRWVRQGDTLRLYDRQENVFALSREADVASDPWTPGTWNAVQVNGHGLPAPWHDPETTLTGMTYAFGADGQVTVRVRTSRGGQERNVQAPSPYRIEGDRLTVPNGLEGEVFAWTLRDGTLRLADPYGRVYLFVPAAATAP